MGNNYSLLRKEFLNKLLQFLNWVVKGHYIDLTIENGCCKTW